MEAASWWFAGLGRGSCLWNPEEGAPGPSSGSLMGRAGFWGWEVEVMVVAGLKFLILKSACWWVGLLSDTTRCGFWSVPWLVLAH